MIELTLIIGAIGCLLLSILMFSQSEHKLVNLISGGISLCIALWLPSILLFMQATTVEQAFVASKVYYVVAAIFVALLALFAFVFPRGNRPSVVMSTVIILSCISIVGLLLVSPAFVTTDIVIDAGGNYIDVDKQSYLLYSLYFIIFFLFGIIVILRKFLSGHKKQRAQLGIFLFSILCMAIPGLVTDLLLPYYGDYSLIWVGPAMATTFIVLVSYGIVRHGMFDIRQTAVRAVGYLSSLAALVGLYYVLAIFASDLFLDDSFVIDQNPLSLILVFGLLFTVQPIKKFFDKVTNKIFYRDNYNKEEFIARLTRVLASTSDLNKLLERATRDIGEALSAEQVMFMVFQEKHYHIVGTHGHKTIPVTDVHFMRDLDYPEKIIVADKLNRDSLLKRLLYSHRIALVLPLRRDDSLIGYLMLGEHRSRRYSARDLHVLETVSDELTIAVQNALSVQEVKDLNENLQQRIDMATEELRHSNAELQRLDEAKDEFVSMASHQLRTPLTSIKGYISMVLDGDVGRVKPEQRTMLEEAFTSSERMVHLINDFLNVSRLQTGKFILDRRLINLSTIVRQEVESLETTADSRNLKLKYKSSKKVPELYIDEGKIRQVVMNFIDNALYYSTPGTSIMVDLSVVDNDIVVTVKDTGIGVPLSEQVHLFNKFFRASNARKHRPDGTGVGLYLAKKVVVDHGGRIIFESVEGKGSKFGFSLPIKRLSLAPVDESDNLSN